MFGYFATTLQRGEIFMFEVELKRIIKMKSTWILTLIGVLVCAIFALSTILQVVKYIDLGNSQTAIVRGVSVYNENKTRYEPIEGEVTPELISSAIQIHQTLLEQYGSDGNIPAEIKDEVLGPYSPVYTWIFRTFSDKDLIHEDITPEQAMEFYPERLRMLENQLKIKYEQTPQVVEFAMDNAIESQKNYHYSYGIGSTNAFVNLGTCAFLIAIIAVIIAAPIFSAGYSRGEDNILRSTKRGRSELAATRISATLLVVFLVTVLCIGTFLIIMYAAFGFDDITSADLLQIDYNPLELDAIGIMWLIVLSSVLAAMVMGSFALFISSRTSSPLLTLAICISVALIPTIFSIFEAGGSFGHGFAAVEGNLFNWIRICLPSGGVSLTGSMLNELISLRFIWIGDFVAWTPPTMLISAAIQIPLWITLTILSYNKHRVK
jgi:hypothetical protein